MELDDILADYLTQRESLGTKLEEPDEIPFEIE
jgi:hypothetical protein